MHEDLQIRLSAAFPAATDAELIRAFREGILLADGLLESEPFLMTDVGRDYRGHLRRAAVMFCVDEFCRRGDLPFETSMERMPRGNWSWLVVRSDRFTAHLCRTDGPHAFPEDTATWQDERFRNQNDLFEPNPSLADLADEVPGMSVWLTFGGGLAGQLQHLCWAMPAADRRDWLAHINILERAARNGILESAEARPTRSLNLRFREHIAEVASLRAGRSEK